MKDLHPALCRIVDGYYQMFVDNPVMRDIWQATQADRALQKLDEEDGAYLVRPAARRVEARRARTTTRDRCARVLATDMTLIAAAVRHAIILPPRDAARVLDQFKTMLPKRLPGAG